MRRAVVLSVCALAFGPWAGVAQDDGTGLTRHVDRRDRVVVYSPHFDEPLPHWGGLSCPSGPMHLYGFEGSTVETASSFRVRAFFYDPTLIREHVSPVDRSGKRALEPAEVTVRLTRRIEAGAEEPLPLDTVWAQVADTTGLAVFTVPEGLYGIRFDYPGVGRDEGVVRIRPARADSLHAYLIPGAICEQ